MKKIFYEKVGRRYKPVSEYDQTLMDALPKGTHLIMSYPGGKSTFYNINPNYAAMIAAGRVAADKMCKAIGDASCMKRDEENNRVLTNEQYDAWEHFKKVMGERGRYVHYNSIRDIAEAGIKALEQEADKLMTHPAVRNAYEQFLTVCELCKDHKDAEVR